MERRKFLQGAGMAGILAAGTAPAIVHAQQQIRWRLASSFPKSLETVFGASEAFSKYVSDATGGKFVISVHPGGELVPPLRRGRRRAAGHHRVCPHRTLLLLRQG